MTTGPEIVGDAPLVTVAICTYGRADLLPRAIRSVLAQTHTNLELIVVNDASPDHTAEVLAGFDDPRLRVITNDPNRGLPGSRNVAIDHATGTYVAFLDDDDEFAPTKLARQVAAFDSVSDRVGAIWCFQRWEGPGGTTSRRIVLRGDVLERVRMTDVMMMQPLLVRRSVFETTGPFDPQLTHYEDFDWTFRLAKHFELETVEEDLVIMHDTPGSMSKNIEAHVRSARYVLAKYPELHGDPRSKSRWLIRIAESHAAVGDRAGWRRGMAEAWRAHPADWRAPVLLLVGTIAGPQGPGALKKRINRVRRRLRNRRIEHARS